MRGSAIGVILGCGLVLGCAGRRASSEPSSEPSPTPVVTPKAGPRAEASPISPSARRIYMLGEERYAEGRYPEAVALWGHAMLQLPPDPAVDGVRHQLLTRMGHGLLKAYRASDDPAYLRDAKSMCELYLAKHEALFGETEQALAERGEVYELLFEIEWRLENEAEAVEPPDDATALAHAEVADSPDDATTPAPAESAGSPDASASPPVATASKPPEAEAEPEAETDLESPDDGELHRFIRVRKVQWARFDDPRVLAFLRDSRDTGPSLLDVEGVVHGPRVLVRAGGLPRTLLADADAPTRRAARRLGLAVIDTARPELRRCYEVAMSRDPIMATRVEVELTVEPDGRVTQPRLVDGSLVDPEGDVCLAQALREAVLQDAALDQPLAVAVPIQFFHEGAQSVDELIWRERKSGRAYETTAGPDPMPAIDEFDFSAAKR